MTYIIKSIGITSALLVAIVFNAFSQDENGSGRERIEAAKIGLISERLGLSPEDAEKFWPVYNEYSMKRQENHREFQEARRNFNPDQATDNETREMLELGRKTKERQLNLEREYSDRLLDVISTRQLMSLNDAEREFKEILLRRLDQRRNQQNGKEQYRQENNERMRNKRNN